MNRRQFLQRFAAVPIAAALIEPVARTIFLPPRGGWPTGHDALMDAMWGDFYAANLRYDNYSFSNVLANPIELTEASLERMLEQIKKYHHSVIVRPFLIVSPEFAQDEEFRQQARFFGYRA